LTFDGIVFPQGAASFADSVVLYSPGTDVVPPFDNPSLALGVPDFIPNGPDPRNHMSLGNGGTLILEFTDNALTTSGDASPDLHVFEVGPAVEPMEIAVSLDGLDWLLLGTLSGQPTSLDIDSVSGVVAGGLYHFVRIVDANAQLSTSPFAGADIDAVGAITTKLTPTTPVPIGASLPLAVAAFASLAFAARGKALPADCTS
jgi:hypothetical protein